MINSISWWDGLGSTTEYAPPLTPSKHIIAKDLPPLQVYSYLPSTAGRVQLRSNAELPRPCAPAIGASVSKVAAVSGLVFYRQRPPYDVSISNAGLKRVYGRCRGDTPSYSM
jgi:hypothetical protein